ncbi:hypothetical protein JQ594_15425 [Bradyrhizobium manausense]|uniref:hypothetical protein n=1 Tax=Bradyrhizobium manausense TaxID=989370 RepID=UPI001BABEE75|nr:hypothetical protein [Bradyrhizobium manausense]MBR0687321.1 hypothetical protein [Bradyrhizobium manausense]
MSDLEWFPSDWVDEMCPPSRPSPTGFIVPVVGGFELGYASGEDSELHNQPLKVGDVVQFVSCERLPDVEATLRIDGTYDLHGRTIPIGHNVVIVDGDIDTVQPSFDALITDIKKPEDHDFSARAMIFPENEPEKRVTLEFANWSDPIPYLFELVDGQPVFTPVPTAKQ